MADRTADDPLLPPDDGSISTLVPNPKDISSLTLVSSPPPNLGLPQMPDATRRVPLALGLILALLLGAYFAVPPIYRKNKVSRAHAAIAGIEPELKAGNIQKAGMRVRLALSLAPEDPQVHRATARFCHQLGSPASIQYWQTLLESGHATRADRIDYVRSLISLDRPEQARQLLVGLLRENLHDFDSLELSLQALLLERRTRDALVAANTLAEQFPENDRGQFHLGQLLLAQREPALKRKGQTILWGLALRDNPFLLPSIRTLSLQTNLSRAELQLLARRIPTAPTNQIQAGLLRLDLSLRIQSNRPPAEVVADALAILQPGASIEARLALADWLFARGHHDQGLQVIPGDGAKDNLPVLQRRLQGLANLNRWPEVAKIVEEPSSPLPPVLRDVYRALVASRLGTPQEIAAHLASAAAGTRDDPSLAGVVASYAEAFDQPGIAAEALQNLMADPGRVARTGPKVLRLLERVDDTRPLLDALDRLIQVSPSDPRLKNERAWWLIVTGQRIEESRAVAEELLKASPDELRLLATLSLAQLREGNADRAIQTIELPFLASTNPPTRARFAYAAALGHAGQREAARRVARPLASSKLRSAERLLITNWFDGIPNP